MLKPPPFLSSRYSLTRFLYLHPSTRRHSTPSLSPGVPLPRASSSTDYPHQASYFEAQMESESYTFGPYKINPNEVFYSTQLSYALVNLRPLVPGMHFPFPFLVVFHDHVNVKICSCSVGLALLRKCLICFGRDAKRFIDLTADETSDLWLTAQKIGRHLESYHKASSLTFAIQDGPQAGQTVPHVHIHILPRRSGDFEKNDEIYDAIDLKEKELNQKLDLDKERKDRSMEEMAEEAHEYRKLFM
ncbi:hypothetical protein Pfo_018414 [Paulownia fortunei]|nr:hypothetical protein Pfo_018414 [Paulownia fortunei]